MVWWCFLWLCQHPARELVLYGVSQDCGDVVLWWCGGGDVVVWWCFCGGVFVVVFFVVVFCGGGVVFLWWCGGVFVVVFLWSHRVVTHRVLA